VALTLASFLKFRKLFSAIVCAVKKERSKRRFVF
jgi:hypothetical protein